MLAQWCLTAWNVAMGRPNWIAHLGVGRGLLRALVGDADRLGGHEHAARGRPARAAPPAITSTAASANVTRAVRRVGSRFAGTSTVTPLADASTTMASSPAGSTSTLARPPPSTAGAVPAAVPPDTVMSDVSATPPQTEPSASPGSRLAFSSADPDRVDHRAGDHRRHEGPRGQRPGPAPRPRRRARAGRSPSPRPTRAGAGRASPARPGRSRTAAAPRSRPRAGPGPRPRESCLARKSEAVWPRVRWSSVMAIGMAKQ